MRMLPRGRLAFLGNADFGGLDQVEDDPAFFQIGGAGRGEVSRRVLRPSA